MRRPMCNAPRWRLGLDPALRPLDALKAWMEKRKTLRAQPPVTVTAAAFLENSSTGADVNVGAASGAGLAPP